MNALQDPLTPAEAWSGLLADVSEARSVAELHAGLVSALRGPPDLGVSVGPLEGDSFSLHGPQTPAFERFSRALYGLRDRLADLGKHERAFRLARDFTRREEDLEVLTRYASECCEIFRVRGLAGLEVQSGALRRVPRWDAGAPQLPALTSADVTQVRAGEPDYREEGVLVPLGGRFRPRAAFWLDAPGRRWPPSDRALLGHLASLAGLEVERLHTLRHTHTLQALHADLLGGAPDRAYRPLLERALSTIPGAECGSLLVRDGNVFRYAASVTFDRTELSEVSFPLEHTRDGWYGLGEDAWKRGQPRVQRDVLSVAQGTGHIYRDTQIDAPLPSVSTIRANIGVPILYGGEVYAFLNIDSLTDPDAFAEDSVDLAQSFGRQAALLLHEAHLRAEVQRAARTDALTGLPNRRAFGEDLAREVSRSRRQGQPLALLVADVRKFKSVNDRYGHAVGDEALVQVGRVLEGTLRAGDVVFRPEPLLAAQEGHSAAPEVAGESQAFRWGGDEFAVLLPATGPAGAEAVRERLREAMRGTRVGEGPIELNIGVAALRPDDESGTVLLREADHDMYRDKQAQRP